MQMNAFVTRFAPSPTGHLHLGHAASAFRVWSAAEAAGGTVLLRLEDIDTVRCRPEYAASILEDLTWLDLDWAGEVRRQSAHFDDYAKVLADLDRRGLVYRCFRTRKEVLADIARAPHGALPVFVGDPLLADQEARRIAAGEAFAWRLSSKAVRETLGVRAEHLFYVETGGAETKRVAVDVSSAGDVILARKDTPASYHLACAHDDAAQGVTHIVRGDDLAASTPIHVVLQALMAWPTPVYCHHPLVTDAEGKRFAKRDKSRTLRAMRDEGRTPEEVRDLAFGGRV
ncbi:MAG: tRNA glutamyl-Q(34) synthetase GluQRS [Pseudomonadota bacterium]